MEGLSAPVQTLHVHEGGSLLSSKFSKMLVASWGMAGKHRKPGTIIEWFVLEGMLKLIRFQSTAVAPSPV